VVEDHIARGAAQKVVHVRPRRFLGERLDGLGPLEVPGHPPVQLELYLHGDGEEPAAPEGVAVYSAGTLVAETFHELAALDLDHDPWTDPRLCGLVDFPALRVAPGSRRGIIPDDAAGLFAQALRDAERTISALLESFERRRAQELDREMVRDLQRLFRDFFRHRPRYAALPVEERDEGEAAGKEANQGMAAPAPEPLPEVPLPEPEAVLLFAKEMVLRSGGDPRFEAPLEQLVEVAAYADRRLAASRGRRRKGEPPPRGEVTPKPVPNGRQQV